MHSVWVIRFLFDMFIFSFFFFSDLVLLSEGLATWKWGEEMWLMDSAHIHLKQQSEALCLCPGRDNFYKGSV